MVGINRFGRGRQTQLDNNNNSNKKGENNKLIPEINTIEAKELINKEIIHGGMIPKVKTCIDAINNGVRAVVIIDGRKPHSILFELFSDKGAGTLIRK